LKKEESYETKAYWLGYLAAMIDGEGTISLHKITERRWRGKFHEGTYWYPIVQVGNDNKESLEILQDLCKGGSISPSIIEGKIRYCYHIPPNIQRKMLPLLSLIIKEEHRTLILEALEKVGRWNKTLENEIRLEQIYEWFKVHNRRGGRPKVYNRGEDNLKVL